MPVSEQTFVAGRLRLAARRWGNPGGLPVMALHGWLDNAASFDCLGPLLGACDLVCLDLAGHGKSQGRVGMGAYNLWQDLGEIFCVADQLGWERFALIGHSRGAMIAFLAAGTLPERISHLVLIEGGLPRTATAEQAPEVLADSLRALRLATARARQFYPGFAEAVAARQQGLFPLTESDALLLARHGVVETDRGFHWSYDPKLMAGSEVRFSIEQVEAFRRRLTAPTQVILGLQGFIAQEPEALAWLARSPEWQQVWLPGDHHLHMHAQCDAVASAIRRHLNIPDDEEGLV